jgi:IS4 transposase
LRGNIPSFIHVSDGKLPDVNALDMIIPEAGSFYVMDRAYLDFERLFSLNNSGDFFVIRSKINIMFKRRYSNTVEITKGIRCDQTIRLTGLNTNLKYPKPLRRDKYHDNETKTTLNLLTNNEVILGQTVADLYRYRWKVELFFKWIKQHLHIRTFFGTSENALKNQIWIAISVYVLIAIIKIQLIIKAELYTILQFLSLTLFEKTPLVQSLGKATAWNILAKTLSN